MLKGLGSWGATEQLWEAFHNRSIATPTPITAREVFKRVPVVKKQLWGGKFWSKGYFISTVGRHGNEEVIHQYVKKRGSEKTYKKLHRQDIQRELF
jgi:putative transposase